MVTSPRRPRFADPAPREWFGYAVWGAVTVVVVIPEIIAGLDDQAPWPTISVTVAHLEYAASWVALLVVAVIVFVAFHVLRYPAREGPLVTQTTGRTLGRTPDGRLTCVPRPPGAPAIELSVAYLVAGVVAVAGGAALAAALDGGNRYVVGYALYGLIGLLFVVAPSVLAYWFARDVPFPTFFQTLRYLERRLRFLAVLVLIGLVLLALHLAFFPWPSVFHVLQPRPSGP